MTPLRFMLDLETLSTVKDAAILSIGVRLFDGVSTSSTSSKFYVNVDDPLGKIDLPTVRWWMGQSAIARVRLSQDVMYLYVALERLSAWVADHVGDRKPEDIEWWSRSPSFDEAILQAAYARAGRVFPIHYRSSRDCRTIEALAGLAYDSANHEAAHDALADAQAQSEHVMRCLKVLDRKVLS